MSKLAILDSCRALGSALLVSLVVGCMDGHSPTTPSRLSPTTVGVSLQVSASRSAAARSLRVVASYARVATPSVLRGIDSVTVPLSVGDTQVPVQIDMATCLQDSDRELPFGVLLAQAGSTCVLHLKLTLLDDAGSVIDEAALAPITARLGEQATTPARELGPRPLPTNAISVGQTFSCVLNEAGAAYCWGSNKFGQFGTGDTVSSTVPRASGGGLRFSQIVVGSTNTCGLTLSGAAYCWGSRASGTLGNGSTAPSKVPIAVEGGLQFQSISAGIAATCGIRTGTGEGYCWGSNPRAPLARVIQSRRARRGSSAAV